MTSTDPNPYASLAPANETSSSQSRRFGCLAAILLVAVIVGLFLYCTRSESRERGLRLQNFRADRYTFDVWTYGDWVTSHNGTLTIQTYEPPYELLLAIRSDDPSPATVEVLQASLIAANGDQTSVLSTIRDRVDAIRLRQTAAIQQPYAVFRFHELLKSHETITLEVQFRVTREQSAETVTRRLTIPGFEKIRRGNTILDALMSV